MRRSESKWIKSIQQIFLLKLLLKLWTYHSRLMTRVTMARYQLSMRYQRVECRFAYTTPLNPTSTPQATPNVSTETTIRQYGYQAKGFGEQSLDFNSHHTPTPTPTLPQYILISLNYAAIWVSNEGTQRIVIRLMFTTPRTSPLARIYIWNFCFFGCFFKFLHPVVNKDEPRLR